MSIIGEGFDFLFKMVVIGGTHTIITDSGVGKTNLLSRFERNQFTHESKATIGVQFATKTIALNSKRIKVQIWDTAGQQRYRAITHAYYKGASGSLIVFDLTRRNTFENVSKWIKELRQNGQENMSCILIGNKCDRQLERAVKQEEAIQLAHQNKLYYLETSAFSGNNVDNAFMTVAREIYDQVKSKPVVQQSKGKRNSVLIGKKIIQDSKENKKKKCC